MIKFLFLVTLLLATVVAFPSYGGSDDNTVAPLLSYPNAEYIPGEYIVVFKDVVTDERISCHHNDVNSLLYEERRVLKRGFMDELISGIRHTYDFEGFRGYSGRFSESVLAKIRQSDDVSIKYGNFLVRSLESMLYRPYLDVYIECDADPYFPKYHASD